MSTMQVSPKFIAARPSPIKKMLSFTPLRSITREFLGQDSELTRLKQLARKQGFLRCVPLPVRPGSASRRPRPRGPSWHVEHTILGGRRQP
jgi:hypothetical protein